eukprot:9794834-Alexandrium_andersonii.AAC.1
MGRSLAVFDSADGAPLRMTLGTSLTFARWKSSPPRKGPSLRTASGRSRAGSSSATISPGPCWVRRW